MIELLVVVSIVSLLVALLLPALAGARFAARQAVCGSNLRQFAVAVLTYDVDHRALPTGRHNLPNGIANGNHVVLRDDYRLPEPSTFCPDTDRPPSASQTWARNDATASIGYWYYGGWGSHPDGSSSSNAYPYGWVHSTFPLKHHGYFPQISVAAGTTTRFPSLPTHKSFLLADLMYWDRAQTMHVYLPHKTPHAVSEFRSMGGNVAFVDAHVEWQKLEPGKSWFVASGYFGFTGAFHWNPSWAAPDDAAILP